MKTVIADEVTFEQDDGIGAFRVQIVQRGQVAVEVLITQAVMQNAIAEALEAIAKREGRKANVIAFR